MTVAPDATAHSRRYSTVAIALHWIIALAILGMIALGWTMGDMADGNPLKEQLYQLHKSIGISILVLTIARILWRLMNPPPPLPDGTAGWERTLSNLVHFAFYALMILMPLSGWVMVSNMQGLHVPTVLYGLVPWPDLPFLRGLGGHEGHEIIENVHSKLAWVAIGLLVLHVAGAVKHEVAAEEGVLKRMLPGLFGKTGDPAPRPKGVIVAFGGAALVFAAIAGIPMLFSGPKPVLEAANASGSNAWVVDPDASSIEFSGTSSGEAFSGRFKTWTAEIVFDPADLENSKATVTIDMTSVETGNTRYNATLKAGEWFALKDFPTATVTVSEIEENGAGYGAFATLAIKGVETTVPFGFTVDIDGDTATMTGSTTLSRGDLNLGQTSDASGEFVSDEIEVTVTVKATRASGEE